MDGRFDQAARCACSGSAAWSLAAALGAAITIGMTAAPASGQAAPLQYDIAPISVDSGVVSFDAEGEEVKAIFSQVVSSPGAYWTRLEFGIVQLSGDERQGNDSYLKVTSLLDGGEQFLDATAIQQWQYNSAYFNGHAVLVELFAHPGTGDNRVTVSGKWIGTEPIQGPLETQCGPSDDRVLSDDARVGRHLPEGCTAWLVNAGIGTNPTCFLSAGHCDFNDSSDDVIEFNVPLSNSNGSINFAHPDDQYPVDELSVQESIGSGNDWAFFGCFQNANTGLFAGEVQGPGFNIVSSVPLAGAPIEMWGYGLDFDTPTRSRVQQFESDYDYTTGAKWIYYNDLDTEGGNSGSPIFRPNSNAAIGIHTNGGCTTAGLGNNSGTRIDVLDLQAALANPQGICVFSSGGCPGPGNCFFENGSPGCNNTSCCNTVCAVDAFCCNFLWDDICAGEALALCANPVCPGPGGCFQINGSPGCADALCCNAVCSIDSFCCDTTWDTLCAQRAAVLCGNCGGPDAGNCFVDNGTPGCENQGCCTQVCLLDPFCCETFWDVICVTDAVDLCGSAECPGAGNCFVDNGTPGCLDALCCNTVCLVDSFCCDDSWDDICADEAINLCGIDACPGQGTCFQPNGTIGCQSEGCCNAVCLVDPYCCDTHWDFACASGALEICAGNPSCPGAGGCFIPHAGLGCQTEACCNIVCEIDAFCCATVWDQFCVAAAFDLCPNAPDDLGACCMPDNACLIAGESDCEAVGGSYEGDGTICPNACLACGDPTAGGCFVDTGTPYCDDGACCSLVCSFDPFCCDATWDNVCADEAIQNCQCGGPATGDCFMVNGTPWCNDGQCCDLICSIDPFCCDTAWDSVCVSAALDNCTCACDLDHDFDVDVDDLLFVLANWGGPGGDCNGDGTTNVDDLLALLAQWGPCP